MHIDDKDKAPEVETTIATDDDGNPTEPIEIDVGAEGEAEGAAEAAAEKPKPKKDSRITRRINTLTAQKAEAETTAQRLARENEELRQQLQETEGKRQVADRAALANFEEAATAKLASAERNLADAHASGDAEKISKATIEASKAAAEVSSLERWRKNNPEPAADADDEPEPKPQPRTQPQQPQLTAEAQQFLADNPWFSPGTKDNPNPEFDLEMHKFARSHGAILEQRFKRQGKAIDQSYWDQLAADVKQEFEIEDEEEAPAPKRGVPKMNGDATVTPARSAQGTPQGGGQQNGTKVTLTPEQRGMARAMVDQGVYKKPDGTPLSYADAERRYAIAVHKDRLNQQAKGA